MPCRGWLPASDGGPVGHHRGAVHPQPGFTRRTLASTAMSSGQCSTRGRSASSQKTCRRDRGCTGSSRSGMMLKDCLTKAKRSALQRPLAQQISHTESYLERARKRRARYSPPTACDRCRGERSLSRSLPCNRKLRQILCPDNAYLQNRGIKFSASPVEAMQSLPCPLSSQEISGCRIATQFAGRDERRQLRQGSRVDVHDVCRQVG